MSEAHADVVARMRSQLAEARVALEERELERAERALIGLGREIERMAGVGRDWEELVAELLEDGSRR